MASYRYMSQKIALHPTVEDLRFGVDVAIPCGLIINELVSNAFKHAFPDSRPGTIQLSLRQLPAEKIQLSIHDDGIGLPPTMVTDRQFNLNGASGRSLGLHLVMALAQQIDAHLEVIIKRGTAINIILNSAK
jgi:two-component sensor histidine kinase